MKNGNGWLVVTALIFVAAALICSGLVLAVIRNGDQKEQAVDDCVDRGGEFVEVEGGNGGYICLVD